MTNAEQYEEAYIQLSTMQNIKVILKGDSQIFQVNATQHSSG